MGDFKGEGMGLASDPQPFNRLRTGLPQDSRSKWLRAAEICVRMSVHEWNSYGKSFLRWASERSSRRPIALSISNRVYTQRGCVETHVSRRLRQDIQHMNKDVLSILTAPFKLSDSLVVSLDTSAFAGAATSEPPTRFTSRSARDRG